MAHDSPQYYDNGIVFITSKNIVNGKLDFSEISYISKEDAVLVNQRSRVDKGDILMSMIGTIGNATLINFEPDFCIKNVALLKPKKVLGNYLIQLIKSSGFQIYLNGKLDGGIQKFISLGVLRELEITVPPPYEQQELAQIFTDMDSEIEKLEEHLNKYKSLKIAMMQELLTGKIRLLENISKKEKQVIKVDFSDKKQTSNTGHNEQFDDAVVISAITAKFATESYPLGAFRRQKLTYLFRRNQEQSLKGFEKKAMGPYKSEMKYRGAEGIAINNKYIKLAQNKTGRGFVAGDNIDKALEYFNRYYTPDIFNWLEQFRYTKNDKLETLATVDFARLELEEKNITVNVDNIKNVIAENEEWKPKLTKPHFADTEIQKAINWSRELFN